MIKSKFLAVICAGGMAFMMACGGKEDVSGNISGDDTIQIVSLDTEAAGNVATENAVKEGDGNVANGDAPNIDATTGTDRDVLDIEFNGNVTPESAEVNENDVNIKDVSEKDETQENNIMATTSGAVPGEKSLRNLLVTSKLPLGNTMYIWGGGWNEEDTGAGVEAVSIGVSPRWAEFADMQNASYSKDNTRYQIHDGLDCSGYVGWLVYNVMENEDGHSGYVTGSTKMAQDFANRGWGNLHSVNDGVHPGDIVSMKGHVWVCLGKCEDGSILIIHSSPPGVRLSGISADTVNNKAAELATDIMKNKYPSWYERYSDCAVSHSYIENVSVFHWNEDTFSDAGEYQNMTAEQIIKLLWD